MISSGGFFDLKMDLNQNVWGWIQSGSRPCFRPKMKQQDLTDGNRMKFLHRWWYFFGDTMRAVAIAVGLALNANFPAAADEISIADISWANDDNIGSLNSQGFECKDESAIDDNDIQTLASCSKGEKEIFLNHEAMVFNCNWFGGCNSSSWLEDVQTALKNVKFSEEIIPCLGAVQDALWRGGFSAVGGAYFCGSSVAGEEVCVVVYPQLYFVMLHRGSIAETGRISDFAPEPIALQGLSWASQPAQIISYLNEKGVLLSPVAIMFAATVFASEFVIVIVGTEER